MRRSVTRALPVCSLFSFSSLTWRRVCFFCFAFVSSERYNDWMKFQLELGLKIVQLTGDQEANYWELQAAAIIITTPEVTTNMQATCRTLRLL